MEFFKALFDYEFLQRAVIAGLLASAACGIIGTYVTVKRISMLSGGIAHSVLGGMGIAYWLASVHGLAILPVHGAIAGAVISALVIGMVSMYSKTNEDTTIGAVWAVGMAVGLLFMSRTPGYNTNLMSYLFGNILMVRPEDLHIMVVMDIVIMIVVFLFFHEFQAVCFDTEFARLRGIRANTFYLLLLVLTALTVVALMQVVGLLLVIALLTLPPAIARMFSGSLGRMMLLSAIFGAVFTVSGLALSYGPDFPSGASIVLVAAAVYLAVMILRYVGTRFQKAKRR